MDIEFLILRTLDRVRPGLVLIESYESSVMQWNYSAKQLFVEHISDEEDQNETSEKAIETMNEINDCEEPFKPEINQEKKINTELKPTISEEEEEEQVDELFEREFNRLMHESLDARRVDRKTSIFDAPIPTLKQSNDTKESVDSVQFSILTKRGNKPQVFIDLYR
jgi:regulator of nonsense transcripts 2